MASPFFSRTEHLPAVNKKKVISDLLYPHLDYTELTTCGHFIHKEQPAMFNEKLQAFVTRLS